MKQGFFFAILMLSILIIPGCIDPQDNKQSYTILIEGKEMYPSLQKALDASVDGDVILLPNGTYNGSFVIDKSITLKGEDKEAVLLTADNQGDVIFINKDQVIIMNLTIINSGDDAFRNFDAGIHINSSYNTIKNCIFRDNCLNIYLDTYTGNNTITQNYLVNSTYYGIYTRFSSENTFTKNIFANNIVTAFYITSHSNNNIVVNNTFTTNSIGLSIKSAEYNTITANTFEKNTHAVYLCCGAKSNIFYHNTFLNSTVAHAQDGHINKWDYNNQGNYWDDYNGLDEDDDGIGDTPYYLYSSTTKKDNYPLMNPFHSIP